MEGTTTMDDVIGIRGSASSVGGATGADPITTEVIRHSLVAAVDEMKATLCRTAVSPVIYDMWDFAAALFDREMRMLGQAKSLPGFLGAMSFCIESAVAGVGGEEALKPGDVLFNTYVFDIGSHANDAAVIAPAFFGGELVGYAVVKAHLLDVGAKEPYCTDTTDVFQEGTIFPGVKLYDGGEPNVDVWRIALANSRTPGELEADINAEIACVRAGIDALCRIIERFGPSEFERSVELMLDHGEGVARRFFEALPDGRYRADGMMDSDGASEDPVPFEVQLEIKGGDLVIDVTNAPATRPGPMNSPLPMTVSAARMAVMALMGGADHVNDGYFRAVEIKVRRDTVFHPSPPAPTFLFGWPANALIDTIHRALAAPAPTKVAAGCGGDLGAMVWYGTAEDGTFWVTYNDAPMGNGATFDGDGGAPLMHINIATVRPASWEVFEIRAGILPECYELTADTGGAGRFRGGNGVHIRYRMLDACFLTSVLERTKLAPWGLEDGADGLPNRMELRFPDGSTRTTPKGTRIAMPAGTVLDLWSGGGGGFGPPRERDPRSVREDIEDGYVTEAAARRDYPHALR